MSVKVAADAEPKGDAEVTQLDADSQTAEAVEEEPIPLAMRIRGLEMPWNRVLAATAGPAGAAHALGPWHPQEFQAECVETIPEAGDMMTFVFRRLDGAPLAFRSGQYMNIDFPIFGPDAEPASRSYSLSSAPTEPWTFSVTVKRDPNGLVSPWVHENVRPGMVLDMLGPVGAFHLPDYDRRARYLLLAAGAGITPLMSMIRTIHSLPGQADVILLYHGSAPDRFAFEDELKFLTVADFRIKVVYALGDRACPEDWSGQVGRISRELIDAVAPDANGRQVYACGPQGYLDTIMDILPTVGVDDTSINVEFFSGDRETLREYAEEVALAEELAEEIATHTEEAQEQTVPELELYETEYDEEAVEAFVEPTEAVDAEAEVPYDEEAESEIAVAGTGEAASAEENVVDPAEFDTVGTGALTMSFVRSGINIRVGKDDNILAAARQAGVRIGANCQEGMCGSCKIVKLAGDVDMHHQGGIRAREIDAGKFLPCCSTPLSDLVVDA